MKVLTLDPSVNNVGWSVFDTRAKLKEKAWRWGTWFPEGMNLEMKLTSICQQIMMEVPEFDILVTEKPAFFSSERGEIAAHLNYTIDLAAVSYFVAGWFRKDHRWHYAITAKQWKGSVSKNITARRFFKAFPKVDPRTLDEHAIDSIMLARFVIETFLPRRPRGLIDATEAELFRLI